MNTEIFTDGFNLPGPRRRCERIARDLCRGRTVLWAFPSGVNSSSLVDLVLKEGIRSGAATQIVRVRHDVHSPVPWLARELGVGDSVGSSVAQLVRADEVPEIVAIEGWDILDAGQRESWRRFINEWVEASAAVEADGGWAKALLVVVCGDDAVDFMASMSSGRYLAKHWYWGWFSGAEMALLARGLAQDCGFSDPESMWAQSVYAELAGTDIEFLVWLCENVPVQCGFGELFTHLRQYAVERQVGAGGMGAGQIGIGQIGTGGVDAGKVSAGGAGAGGVGAGGIKVLPKPLLLNGAAMSGIPGGLDKKGGTSAENPEGIPVELLNLWSRGMLDWNGDDGVFLHSALLAVIGDSATLYHRIWRGQARLLLPWIDAFRLLVCGKLQRDYPDWPEFLASYLSSLPAPFRAQLGQTETDGEPDLDGEQGPGGLPEYTAEFGPIRVFLESRCSESRHASDLRPFLDDIDLLRKVRNLLAHYRPLPWEMFAQTQAVVQRGYDVSGLIICSGVPSIQGLITGSSMPIG